MNSQSGQLPVGRVLHRYRRGHSPLQKRESTRTSFLYCTNWKSKHFNWNVTEWKATQSSLRVFSGKIVQMGALQKVAKFHTNSSNFVACLPNPYKLSTSGDIWKAIILPFSSSKYFCSCSRLSNLVGLSFEYLSFSNKRKTTTLFPSPPTFGGETSASEQKRCDAVDWDSA